jgi:hypothetical protein
MRLEPFYRLRFTYPNEWSATISGKRGTESQFFFLAEGECSGRISGQMRGANHPRQRVDGTFVPDFQGVIETDDGAVILFDYRGYGRAYPVGRRQIVLMCLHQTSDERYEWLNDAIFVATGEVRSYPERETELVIDVAELIWEPLAE